MPINIEIIDNETFFPQPRSAKCPTIKALTKKPKINPPVGPIKYIRPPPNAKTGSPIIPLKIYKPTVRVASFPPNNIAIINTAKGCKVIGTG